MSRYISGIKPTGHLTLGNYIGAIKQFVALQNEGELFLFVADLHALTLPINPQDLRKNSIDIIALYLASGLDKDKVNIFLQSDVPAHSELAIILQNYLYMGELSRMTQFKDKTQKMNSEAIGVGIFTYPILMAGDIVLYDADYVPVGDDQVQHVELARDLVRRFNNRYGEILKMPKAVKVKNGSRIMSLSNPTVKMSKSDPKGDIFLDDDLKVIRKKIMSAVTDLGHEIKYDVEEKPGISNLLTIYSALTGISIPDLEKKFAGYMYGQFKQEVANAVVDEIDKLKKNYAEIINSNIIDEVLNKGKLAASKIAEATLHRVQKAVGLYK